MFTPAANWNGSTSTTYNVANNKHTRSGTINITVLAVNDAPTANDDTVTATEDTATNVTAGLLANDTDPDGDTLAVTAATNATGGTVGLLAGVVTFTPTANACGAGEGSFDYTVGDGHGGSDPAHATVNVTCVDDAPVATDDGASGTEDADVVIVAADLAANDTDAEGDALTVTGVSNATGGTVGLVAGTITFTPAADLCGTGVGRLRLHGRRRQRRHRHRPRHHRPHLRQRRPGRERRHRHRGAGLDGQRRHRPRSSPTTRTPRATA